jgi:hypothetical protein
MKKLRSGFLCLTLLAVNLAAQPKVFIAPMDDGFDSFLAAAILDNKVPLTITMEECSAAYIIIGQAVRGQSKWYDTVFGAERDRNQGSIKLLKVSDKTVVWAGAAGDRSLWWGALKSGGQKKVANRLARELKKEYFSSALPAQNPQGSCAPSASTTSSTPVENKLPESPATANLRITSRGEGAEVLLNGKVVGNTPLSLSVKSGEFQVIVRRGRSDWQTYIRLDPGKSLEIDAPL